jgi:hypothetical protein
VFVDIGIDGLTILPIWDAMAVNAMRVVQDVVEQERHYYLCCLGERIAAKNILAQI